MNISNLDRAQTLVEALPYIQKYYGKTVVIKYGGNAMTSPELQEKTIEDIVLLSLVGIHVVVVHGGGPEINRVLARMGKTSRFVNGLRYTDEETMDVVRMVLCGKVNKDLAAMINRTGGRAVGLCGTDDSLLMAKKLEADGLDYGLVGEIVGVRADIIKTAQGAGLIPVVATVAQGVDGGDCYNINADTAAAQIAIAVGAEKLILLTDVKGIMADPHREDSLISYMGIDEVPPLIENGVITGGMIPKVNCCVDAIRGGVRRTHILDGRIPHSILIEVLSHAGIGTMITRDKK